MAELPTRLQVGMSFEEAMPLLNQMMDEIDGENRTKVFLNAQVNNALLGYQKGGFAPVGDYGFKVSKVNPATGVPYDVTTATDDQLAFSTGFSYLKVAISGVGSFATDGAGSATGHATYAHNLGYPPAFAVYSEVEEDAELIGTYWELANERDSIYSVKEPSVFGAVDATNLYVVYGSTSATPSTTYHFKYIVYADPVTT